MHSFSLMTGGSILILTSDGKKPLYVQIAEWIETEILTGHFNADEKVYSQYQLADIFNINPATASKGLNLLVADNILYKKRGLGMFVTTKAAEIILNKRKNHTLKDLMDELVVEAAQLNVSEEELISMVRKAVNHGESEGEKNECN